MQPTRGRLLPRHYFRLDPETYSIVKDRPCHGLCRAELPEREPSNDAETETVVELIGIEPTTSGLQSPRSPS